MRLVLSENADHQVAGIDEVGEYEIDQAIGTTEGNCGLGPVRGQRIQPLALTAGQDDAQHVWCFPHGYKLSATANRCQRDRAIGRSLTDCPSMYLALAVRPVAATEPATRCAGASAPNYRAVYAGGDDDSGVSTGRLW